VINVANRAQNAKPCNPEQITEKQSASKYRAKTVTTNVSFSTKAERLNDKELLLSYIRDISKYPLLAREQQDDLLKMYHVSESKEAFHKLINCNLRLVIMLSKKYQYLGLTLTELINEGNMGLMTAIKRFNVKKIGEVRLESYAAWWIRQKILQAINEQGSQLKVSANKFNDFNKIKRAMEKQPKEMNSLSLEEVANDTGISERDIVDLLNRFNVFSLDEAMNIEAEGLEKVEDSVDNKKIIDKLMNCLGNSEKFIISMYYGLEGVSFNFEEIGNFLNISIQQTRQIKHAAVKKLRKGILLLRKEEKMH
jgi:RNA polymerase primary sigma factor